MVRATDGADAVGLCWRIGPSPLPPLQRICSSSGEQLSEDGLPTAACTGGKMLTVRAAMCQILCIDGDREGNFRRMQFALDAASAGGAQLACLPESCVLGWQNPEAHTMAAPIPGADSERIGRMAQEHGLIVCAGLDEKDGGHLYGAAVLVDGNGAFLLKHRKLDVLPWLMDPPYSAGSLEAIAVAETSIGRVGVLICADTFSEENVRRMAALQPDLLVVPYGWAAPVGKWPDHARELHALVCRVAQSVGCATIGTNLVGQMTHGPWAGQTYGGQSVAADASGRVLAVARDRDVDVVLVDVPVGRR